MKIEIRQAQAHHCGPITRLLRAEQAADLMRRGVPIHREIRAHLDRSYYARSAFIDDHLVALWGAEGSLMASSALVWVALSQYAVKFPVTVLRQAKREIEFLAKTKSSLVTTVLPNDGPAHRLIAFLGFESPDGFGGGPARSRSARNNLLRYTKNAPQELMVVAGGASQVFMVYRPEQHGWA